MDFSGISAQLGINPLLLAVIFIWGIAWKLTALWKSARRGSLFWFIVLALVNTVGILEILYIFVFSELEHTKMIRHRREKLKKKSKKKSKRK